jgi:hypothetical protein
MKKKDIIIILNIHIVEFRNEIELMYNVLDANHSSPSLILIPLGLCIIQGWNLLYMIIIPIQGIYIYIGLFP